MTPAELEALLVVQERDTALDRLRHRRATLPERAELEAATGARARAETTRAEVQAQHAAVATEERRLDDEARALGERVADADKRLYSGTISSPRELQAMQADVEMLKRQRSDLEDEELDVMERREALDRDLASFDDAITTLSATIDRLKATIAAAESEIDAQIAVESSARAEAVKPVGDALLRDYEKRRAQNRGAGAARLVGTTCQACHLTIPSTEAEHIRRAEGREVSYCDNCSAILVP